MKLFLFTALLFAQTPAPKFHRYISPDRSLWIGAAGDRCVSAVLYDLTTNTSHTPVDVRIPEAHQPAVLAKVGSTVVNKADETLITNALVKFTKEKITDWRASTVCKEAK